MCIAFNVQSGLGQSQLCHCAGFRIGRQLVERYTQHRPRLGEHLDVIKFICKEFWLDVFRKQVNLLSLLLGLLPICGECRNSELQHAAAGGQPTHQPQGHICAKGQQLSLAQQTVHQSACARRPSATLRLRAGKGPLDTPLCCHL